MRKITMTLAAAIFVVGSMAVANAQTQRASSLSAQRRMRPSSTRQRAGGMWGRWCPPGRHQGSAAHIAAGALPAGKQSADRRTCRQGRSRRAASFVPSLRANGSGPKRPARWSTPAKQSGPACEPGNDEPSAYSNSTTPPSRIVTRRSMREASSRLWVAISAASPEARTNCLIVAKTRPDVRGSRLPVGSSASSTRGALATARAIATRCCSPPESSAGRWVQTILHPQIRQLPRPRGAPPTLRDRGSSAAASRSPPPRIPAADGGIDRRSRSRRGGCGCAQGR